MTDLVSAAITRLQRGATKVEFIRKPYSGWPCPRPGLTGSPVATGVSAFRVAVLDSSFNPPTLAHRALSLHPAAASPTEARLLLLSVRNADKTPRPGDASPSQRVEMMVRLACDINAAVALVDAPAFIHKAERLRTVLPAGAQLAFIQGVDTLERFLVPRYYGDGSPEAMDAALRQFFAPDGSDARVICARRAMEPHRETATLEAAGQWVRADRVSIADIDDELQTFSSSEVRAKVLARDDSWCHMVPNYIAQYIEEQKLYLEP
ncbi:Nucleotidylyl transferase [Lactarius pseudohatsudake]|nr:Nucleotidylyl transferase [Lactarius pseudohatsudake]